jgi:peptide/nickel transport system substrate-binding protein
VIKKASLLFVLLLAVSMILVSCASDTPAVDEGPVEAISEKHGGVLRSAYYAPVNMDPAFFGSVADDWIGKQWGDFLVYVDEQSVPDPSRSIAESWEADEDAKVWTFYLRQGVLFHDGKEMTSRDVKFTFDRLRDPDVGAATVGYLLQHCRYYTPDDYTVVFELTDSNTDFPFDLFDYHAIIADADNEDFATNWNGTGPFMITSYSPEDRIVFERNPNYWMKDSEGNPLPYLDGIEIIFLADSSAQIEALRGGQIDYLIYLPTEFIPGLEADPNIEVLQAPSNTHYVISMRSDQAPADDVRVRQALKLGTDRAAILDGAVDGLGTPVAIHQSARHMGTFILMFPNLFVMLKRQKRCWLKPAMLMALIWCLPLRSRLTCPAIATIWKEQMAEIGVNVEIQLVPSDLYYGADNMWMEAPFSTIDWGARPIPQPYLDLAYSCDAIWNHFHWCDPELDELAALAAKKWIVKRGFVSIMRSRRLSWSVARSLSPSLSTTSGEPAPT